MERTLFGEDKQTCFAQGAGTEGTILLDEYFGFHKVIRLVDTRGFFEVNDATTAECLNIMTGRWKILGFFLLILQSIEWKTI